MFYLLLQNTTLYPVKSKHFIDSVLLDLSDTPHPDRKRSPVKTKLNVMKKFMKISTNLKGFNMKMLFLIDNGRPGIFPNLIYKIWRELSDFNIL